MSQEHEQTPPAQSSGALPPSQPSEPPPCSGEGDDDLIFQLEEWMAQPTPREQRRYLEKHIGLRNQWKTHNRNNTYMKRLCCCKMIADVEERWKLFGKPTSTFMEALSLIFHLGWKRSSSS